MSGRLYLLCARRSRLWNAGALADPRHGGAVAQGRSGRCLIARDLSEGMEIMARRCAEQFVRQNGYTDVPATSDSSRWVHEWGEGGPWPPVMGARVGSLERRATAVQCSARQCIVLFRLRRPVLSCAYLPSP